ncbi:MAG: acVLRF1 family peptidyl-tRNA hydrolase [Propionicimonas sp.]|nr:acVLRF1 family peptidyl-tRNA hydrolase [Propionicimonas sp.]
MPSPSSAEPRTVRVDPARLAGWLERFAGRHGPVEAHATADRVRCVAPDGAVAELLLRWGPLPGTGDPLAAAVAYATRERTVGVLLVRRKAHAAGVFLGSGLVEGRHDSHYVQGRTKAGGWSQQRYARRRSNQAGRAFDEAAEDAARILVPRLAELEALVTGGDGAAVRGVLASPGLEGLRALAEAGRHPVYPVADPNRSVLVAFPAQFRAVPIELNDLA